MDLQKRSWQAVLNRSLGLPARGNSGYSAGALRDPVFEQSRNARNHQETDRGKDPLPEAPPHGKGTDRHESRSAGPHRRDHVADPVNEVQKRAFRLGTLLALDGYIDLRGRSKVLRHQPCLHSQHKQGQYNGDSQFLPPDIGVLHLVVFLLQGPVLVRGAWEKT